MATGTVEEKIFQRQLAKQGLQQVVDDKEQVNALSTKDLRNLFKLRHGTPSDTHDKLRCVRCQIITDNGDIEARKVLPKKLQACGGLVNRMMEHEDALQFLKPLVPQDHGVSTEAFEQKIKQPMDLATIKRRLELPPDKPNTYTSVSGVAKDVNRIFTNVLKVWSPGQDVADAARRLQGWWVLEWTKMVPELMSMKSDDPVPRENETSQESGPHVEKENERGDNFQEQLGMPDEEDMRNWSHHHSADTVDDPVFRMAMRGFDSVSFVFGLEVTWSLIQQRKQEEEERQAMLELEEAQNCGGGDDEDSPSNSDDDIIDAANNDVACPEVTPIGFHGEMESTSNTEPVTLSDFGEAADVGPGDEASDHALDKSIASSKSDSDPQSVVADAEADETTHPPVESPAVAEAIITWMCKACTFENELSRKTCQMCKNKKPKETPNPSSWICQACTFENTPSRKTCSMCKIKKGVTAK